MLSGPSHEPTPRRTAPERNGDASNPQSGATATKPHDSRMLTGGTAFDATTGDGLASNVGPMREPKVFNNARARRCPRALVTAN